MNLEIFRSELPTGTNIKSLHQAITVIEGLGFNFYTSVG
jgi:hypothetical protein